MPASRRASTASGGFTKRGPRTARSWYAKAAAQGDQPSARKLRELDAVLPAAASPAPPAAAIGSAEIREVQQLLKRLNFDPGPADGKMGEKTADAIRLYQRFAGLEVDGTATAALLEDLRAVAETVSGGR